MQSVINKFERSIGLEATQALAMLAMSYQVRDFKLDEPREALGGDLYRIPDICMGRSNGDDEYYVKIAGYLLDAKVLSESYDKYLESSLRVANDYLVPIYMIVRSRYNQIPLSHFEFLSKNSSIVHPDYKDQFARGLYYGYNGDFCTASLIMLPIIERFVRGLCEANGIEVVNKIGQPLGLGALLEKSEIKDRFSAVVWKEMRAIIVGKHGLNLRNILAHGNVTDDQTCGIEFFYMWWFALRMAVSLKMFPKDKER